MRLFIKLLEPISAYSVDIVKKSRYIINYLTNQGFRLGPIRSMGMGSI